MLPWKTVINLDRSTPTPVYLQITNAIIREISHGRLKAGQALPGSRSMSQLIGVNRKTTIIASQGWIEVVPSQGTFVAKDLPLIQHRPITESGKHLGYPKTTHYSVKPWTSSATKYHKPANLLAIDDGSPDTRLAPLDTIWRNCRSLTRGPFKNRLLSYGDLLGDPYFREVLSDYLANTRGMACKKEHLMITRGSIMALHLVANQILEAGDWVMVGDSNYPAADSIIKNTGARLHRIQVDHQGISTDQIAEACKRKLIKAIYITPHHHFPTTVTLSAERRLHLLELAERYGFAVIEDDYDYDFHYASGPILPLASYDACGSVIYLGSFSKLLAPGIRVGYLVAPTNLLEPLGQARRHLDRQGDFVLERALAQLILDGDLQRHLKKSVREYHLRRDLFCEILHKIPNDWIKFQVPEGGMAIWTEFNKDVQLDLLSNNLANHGFYLDTDREMMQQHHATRLGFASLNPSEITQAGSALTNSLEAMLTKANI